MKNKTILVTGGAGFIGSNFIYHLFENYKDVNIINFDKLTYAGNTSNLRDIEHKKKYTFINGDIYNKKEVYNTFIKYDPSYVINFAAESHVDRSIQDSENFVKTNVLGVENLLNLSLKFNIQKFIQISTDEVYGSLGNTGYFTEASNLDPHSPYSSSKASADLLTKAYFDTYSLPINITRCSNNYGPYQNPEKLIPKTIYNCLLGKKIPVYGTGKNIRDWIHVKDHCAAIEKVLNEGKTGEVYNIGTNNEWTNFDIVELIIHKISEIVSDSYITEDLIEFVEDRKGHDWRYAIDSSKIQQNLDWEPKINFEEGIKNTINWYLKNRDWLFDSLRND